jgi:hypothetical protein
MHKKTFYGFLISGGFLWAVASIVLIGGSLKDVIETSSYQIAICKVANGTIELEQVNRNTMIYNLNIKFQYKNISESIIVYVSDFKNNTLSYFIENYQIGSNQACFVSNSNIVLELEHQYYTVLASGILFLISLSIIITLMILRCIEEYRHRGYTDIEVLKQDELESPLQDTKDPFIDVLKNKQNMSKEEFERLRLLQVQALAGRTELAMSTFKAEVYKTLSGIIRDSIKNSNQ